MCHETGKTESVAATATSQQFLPGSLHRKRVTVTVVPPAPKPANSNNAFGASAAVSVNIVPPAGYSVLLQGVSIDSTVAYTGLATIKDGGTTVNVQEFSAAAAGPDAALQLSAGGLLGGAGNTINVSLPNTPAASTSNVNVVADFVPSSPPRVSITEQNPAVLDRGVTLLAAYDTYTLDREMIGDLINRNLQIIANVPLNVSVVDIQEVGPRQGHHPAQDAEVIDQETAQGLPAGAPSYQEIMAAIKQR